MFIAFLISLVIFNMFYLWSQQHEKNAGVTIYKPDKFQNGYTLYNSRNRSVAKLLDMKNYVVHRWSYPPKSGEFVWEYLNPDFYVSGRCVTICRSTRYSPELIERLIKANQKK